MSNPFNEGVNTGKTNDETRSLVGQQLADVNGVGSSQSIPVSSEGLARQIRAVTDPLSN